MIPVLVPLFVSAFRRADELAMAMGKPAAIMGGEGAHYACASCIFTARDLFATLLLTAIYSLAFFCWRCCRYEPPHPPDRLV